MHTAADAMKFLKFEIFLLLLFFFAIAVSGLALYLYYSRGPVTVPNKVFENKDYQEFDNYTKRVGPESAYEVLKRRYSKNEPEGHDFAHIIGHWAYAQRGLDGLVVCDSAFNYGCQHGFAEKFLDGKDIYSIRTLEAKCVEFGPVHAPSCLHGIGHAVMIDSSYNLDKALADCEILMLPSQTYCFDGVFMERVVGSMLPEAYKLKVTEENLDEPCGDINERYRRECFRNQPTAWMAFFQSPQKVVVKCVEQESQFRDICLESAGYINVMSVGENRDVLLSGCRLDQGLADSCVIGEVKELMFEGKSADLAFGLCFEISPQRRLECSELHKQMFADYQVRFAR